MENLEDECTQRRQQFPKPLPLLFLVLTLVVVGWVLYHMPEVSRVMGHVFDEW